MIYKKILIVFLLILCIFSFFSFSSVHAENINVTSSSSERMKADIDYFKQLLKNNNINNMNDLQSFFGADNSWSFRYFYIQDAGHSYIRLQSAYFYNDIVGITNGSDNYSYYGIQQNSFTLPYTYSLYWVTSGVNNLNLSGNSSNSTFTAPSCWFLVKTADLFTMDSSQIIENTLTQDNSKQDDINLGSHNNEMNTASDSIKNSNLYNTFSNLSNKLQEAFTYNDNDVSTLPISFGGKNVVLKSNEISIFLRDNNLGFVITLWQSILWFSLFYTMFIFIRKLYKSVTGGNPVDDVQNTLSREDDKIVGGF